MAKNLYRFYCTLESGFDEETTGGDKTIIFVYLAPAGYGKFTHVPSKLQYYDKKVKTTFIYYTTHNADSFWQNPR